MLLLDEFNFPHSLESMLELTLRQMVGGALKSRLRRSWGLDAHTTVRRGGGGAQADAGGGFLGSLSVEGLGTPG